MAFATLWLEKKALFPQLVEEPSEKSTGIIVVIPAFDEPEIAKLLDSLASCTPPSCGVEIIVIVNAGLDAAEESILNNRLCVDSVIKWKSTNPGCFFRLFVFDTGRSLIPGWGAGLARKTGMDEALRRFSVAGNPEGVIVSLDADCTVEKNYFISVSNDLLYNKDKYACSIYFEHPVGGTEFPEAVYRHITLYELNMRYFVRGLIYSGFPWPYHTIGSAMAVKALRYMQAGGMNRRQAGEDFYFIRKLLPAGGYFNLNSTTVFPSPRKSFRVPFGTGPSMIRFMEKNENIFFSYNVKAFEEMKILFCDIGKLFCLGSEETKNHYQNIPEGIRSFISYDEWLSAISEIRSNTSSSVSFRKRFFVWFDMLRIVRYLNHVHKNHFAKENITEASGKLIMLSGDNRKCDDPRSLLTYYRFLDKNT